MQFNCILVLGWAKLNSCMISLFLCIYCALFPLISCFKMHPNLFSSLIPKCLTFLTHGSRLSQSSNLARSLSSFRKAMHFVIDSLRRFPAERFYWATEGTNHLHIQLSHDIHRLSNIHTFSFSKV